MGYKLTMEWDMDTDEKELTTIHHFKIGSISEIEPIYIRHLIT